MTKSLTLPVATAVLAAVSLGLFIATDIILFLLACLCFTGAHHIHTAKS